MDGGKQRNDERSMALLVERLRGRGRGQQEQESRGRHGSSQRAVSRIFTHNTELPFLSLKQLLFFLLLIFLNVSLSATTSFLLKFLRGYNLKAVRVELAE